MAKYEAFNGATGNSIELFVQDATKSNGAGLIGLTASTPGLTAFYSWPTGLSVGVALVALATPNSPWVSGGFIEKDAVNQPGVYRFDPPDASYAPPPGTPTVKFYLKGAGNMAPSLAEVAIVGYNPQSPITLSQAQINAIAAAVVASPAQGSSGTIGGQISKIGTGRITTVSPVAQDGTLTIVQGDTYSVLLNNALQWNDQNAEVPWPNLTECVISLDVGEGLMTAFGTATIPTGPDQLVTVQPTSYQTNLLLPGVYNYNLVAVWLGTGSGTSPFDTFTGQLTLAAGQCTVISRQDQVEA